MLMPMTMSDVDKISSLSDALLCYILSFLPTIDAVATCLLSKRWTRLWLSVPTLDFDEFDVRFTDDEEGHFRFVRMMYAVMLKRDVTSPVKKFCLKGRYRQKSSDVAIWVNTAIQRRVEHLELRFSGTGIFLMKLPSGILGSRTLVVLKLSQLVINGVFVGGFPSLKIMHLYFVSFEDHRHLFQLLLGCPILERMHVSQLAVGNTLITDEVLCLEKLVSAYIHIMFMSDTYIPLEWICRVKVLHLHLSLSYPKYKTGCTFHNLTCLKIFVLAYKWGWLLEVLKHCPKLQIFEIQRCTRILLPEDKEWVHPQFFPECFSSHLETCSLINYGGCECELQFAKYIMQNAKVLCTMRICSNISSNTSAKHEMLKALSLCPRSSITCELSFE